MTEKEKFISDKMRILVGKEKYSRPQAYAIANSMYNKMQMGGEKKYAQQSLIYGLPNTFQAINPILNNQSFTHSQDTTSNRAPSNQQYRAYFETGYGAPTFEDMFPAQSYRPNPNNVVPQAVAQEVTPRVPEMELQKEVNSGLQGLRDKEKTVYNDYNRVNIYNPDAEISLGYALNYAGRGFGAKNPWQAGIGTATSLLKGTRNFMTGFAEGKESRRVAEEMMDDQFSDRRQYTWKQQGGKMTVADVLAKKAITDEGQGNINLEGKKGGVGEYILTMGGVPQPVIGDGHHKNGKIADGVNTTLNYGDRVLAVAKIMELPKQDVKEFNEIFGTNIKKSLPPAEILKIYEKKIGQTKLEKEKADKIIALEKAQKTKDKQTRELNVNALLKSFGAINEKINTLADVRTEAFEFLFNKQEMIPKKGDGTQLYDDNGKVIEESQETEMAQQGGKKLNKLGVENSLWNNIRANRGSGKEPTKEMLEQERKIKGQEGGEMYVSQLAKKHNIPLERAMELIKMQEGGEMEQEQGGEEEQVMQIIVEMLQEGASPEQVVEELVQMGVPQEVAIGMIEQVMGGGSEQMTQGGEAEQIMQMVAEALQNGAQPEEIMQEMVNSGVPEEQAMQAIQGVMQQMQGQEQQMAQQGGQKRYAQEGLGLKAVQNYLAQWKEKPDYQYKNIAKTAERFKPFLDKYGVKYTEQDLKSMTGLDNLAGRLQETISAKYPELAEDYGANIEPTRKGLQKLIDKGIIKPNDFGVVTDNKGKVKIGSFNVLSAENQKAIKAKIDALPEQDKKEYAKANYVDYESYFRTLDAKEIEFKDKAEYDKYLEDNKDKKIGDYIKTDKVGAYIKPIYNPDAKGALPTSSNTPLPDSPKEKVNTETATTPQNKVNIVNRDRVKTIVPNFLPNIPFFSALQPIANNEVNFNRVAPIKMSPENMLAEAERNRQVDVERLQSLGMSPQEQEAILAQGLATSQMTSNDAISKVETFNAQNQYQTDMFNANLDAKEKIMNIQFGNDYQDKMMASLANQEDTIRGIYRDQFLQAAQNRRDISNMNLINARSDQFAITPDGVEYLNNRGIPASAQQGGDFLDYMVSSMSSEQKDKFVKKAMAQQGGKVLGLKPRYY